MAHLHINQNCGIIEMRFVLKYNERNVDYMFKFTKDCMTGIDIIDEEHRQLFEIINHLVDKLGSNKNDINQVEVEDYIQYFIEYGKNHFAHEEAWMEKHHDPELQRQRFAHQFFMNKMQSIDLMGLDDAEKRPITKDLLVYMIKWLYGHILNSDTLIGKVVHLSDSPVTRHNKESDKDELVYCEFLPKYHTGIEQIDKEHENLFAIINDIYKLIEDNYSDDKYDEVLGLLDRLEKYTQTHFAHEEEIMEKNNFPELDFQRNAHASFIERLSDRDMGEGMENPKEFLEGLLDFLYAWLGNHIMKHDMKIAQYISL